MRRIYFCGLLNRIIACILGVLLIFVAIAGYKLDAYDSIIPSLILIIFAVIMIYTAFSLGVFINYKKGCVTLKIIRIYKWSLSQLHTINIRQERNYLVLIIVYKDGEQEEIRYNCGFSVRNEYDRIRDELGRLIFVDYDHQELNEENNENP